MFERYYRELLGFLSRKVSDRSVAADMTQESYARVYAAQASGSTIGDPRALLYQTARNLVIDHQRHGEVRAGVELPPAQVEPVEAHASRNCEPETALASRQGVSALVSVIDNLPPRCREAFMLNRFEGLTYAQVGAHMGISVKMVEQHIKHALDACERCRARSAGEDAAGPHAPRKKLNRSRHE
ncbi:sigma-70 family RNA polymerase sigma factor [Variovorax sp. ZS18.2.2]|uniref:sigma-70 family RNA polymerase sigma factor n=1 Tax=Variovorax sp. ZS18.2.2 TaxID=2971255 RepID=UPI0021517135|nr:sigma-70 family RNA polymerase sigma factor [Variovorax sp. ZS18.2.2]MCR6480723.1 sigma-70 family RNA polymerase sigma factor [Variovorax sp. ZS18.2.2]